MAFDVMERKNNNAKILAGALVAGIAAAGAVAAHPKGRQAIKNMVGDYTQTDEIDTESSLASWLKDAYAMEEAQIKSLKAVMSDFKDHEEIFETMSQHLAQTEKQKSDVKKALDAIGEKPAKSKEILGALAGLGSIDMKMFQDKRIKTILTMLASERFEEASYEALAAAAANDGKKAISNTMKRIAREEREMAVWLEGLVPKLVSEEIPKIS